MSIQKDELRTLVHASIVWLAFMALVATGVKQFDMNVQGRAMWLQGFDPFEGLAIGHPHALRYLLYWPVFKVADAIGAPADRLFTPVSAGALLGLLLVMVRCEFLLSNYQGRVSAPRGLGYAVILIVLAFLMNGRLVFAFAGYALMIYAVLDFVINQRWSWSHVPAAVFGVFLTSVSSGTIAVSMLFLVLVAVPAAGLRTPAATRFCGSIILILLIFTPQVALGVDKNLRFFGGGFEGAVSMLKHGAGVIFLRFGILGLLCLSVLAAGGLATLWWLHGRLSARLYALTLAIAPAAIGGLFGFSTMAMGIIPILLVVRSQTWRDLREKEVVEPARALS